MSTTVLLDSEIGNHVDDAIAMAAVCRAPDVHLVGVTTTGENALLRAALARRLLNAYGASDVPVAAGEPPPQQTMRLRGRTLGLAEQCPNSLLAVSKQGAVELMRSAIEAHPGLTIITTAPLTNIGALLVKHPKVSEKIGRIIFMGGWPTQALPEYNLRADPEAVATVFATEIPLTAVGYEVTLSCTLKRPHIRQLQRAPDDGPRLLYALYEAWQNDARTIPPILHDPLTVAVLCQPHLVQITPALLRVQLDPGPGRGALSRARDGKRVDVCTAVHAGAYLSWLINLIAPERPQQGERQPDPSLWHVQLGEAYHVAHYAGWSNVANADEHHVVILVTDGEGSLQVNSHTYDLGPGSAVYLPAGKVYKLETVTGMKSYWFHFSFYVRTHNQAYESSTRIPDLAPYYPQHARTPLLLTQAERILRYWLNPWSEGHLLCQASLLELLAHLFSITQEQLASADASVDDVVLEARLFIQARARRHLTLEDVSQHVGMSKYHLARKFKAAYGMAPLQYHSQLRMQQAKSLLSLGTMPIGEVAAQLGYASPQAFSRAFQRAVGVPPSEYNE